MSQSVFDFVVVGGGIVGSWTAKELREHGNVLLLEQFREPHTRGSSHGQTRIIRSGYKEPFFAEMMPHAFRMWRRAESEMNEKLIETTGTLWFADSPQHTGLRQCVSNMKRFCPDLLVEPTAEDIKTKFGTTLKYPETSGLLFDKSGGLIYAHKAVQTVQKWFKNSGGMMWECCKVYKIEPISADKVKVITSKGDVFAKSVVICAGPWTQDLLTDLDQPLPLQPVAVTVYYWKEKELGAYSASSGFPAVQEFRNQNVFFSPSLEYPGLVKVCCHYGVPINHPDERDKVPRDLNLEKSLKEHIKEHFPLLETEPAIIEPCMYTCTPDKVYILDSLPGHKNIVFGAGFSGTGFKTAPVVGKLLSELARGEAPFLDISPYRLSRFSDS